MTSTLMARSEERRRSAASVWKGTSPLWRCTGSGGTTTASPRASTAAGCVMSGSPARRLRGSRMSLPVSRFSACSAVSQRPSLVMPMGTTSYLSLSIALRTEAAESSETSCSPLRPPNKTPTRSFSMTFQCGRAKVFRQSQGWFKHWPRITRITRILLLSFLLIRVNPRKSAAKKLIRPHALKNFFAERRQGQFHRQIRRLVMLVDNGIDFHDLKAQHAAMVGDDFHRQMSLAVGGSTAHRSADAGSVFGIDPIHVERDMVAGSATSGHAQGFFHDGAHAALVDVAHGEDADAGAMNVFFLYRVNVADADQHAIFRLDLGREIEDVPQFRGPQAHQRGERHAVHVAAGRGIGSVDVGVRVDPDQAHALVLAAVELGDA